ncbi:MAG: hypothetical protein M5U31_00680 [Acidimicrobiia bacterium]|nr:hypothetical protein [Acidimicrobiia bacterium]
MDDQRPLPVTEAVRESTRLVVGASLLAGRGLAAMIRRYGTPESETPPAGESGDDPLARPLVIAGVARTLLIGLTFEVERAVLDVTDRLARSTAPVSGVIARSPAVAPISRLVGERLLAWYARGLLEEQRSREYAGTALLGAAGVGTDFIVEHLDINGIVQSLELDDLILQSTGGITGEMLDTVRAQAVGMDALVDRITAKITRRTRRDGPRGVDESETDSR